MPSTGLRYTINLRVTAVIHVASQILCEIIKIISGKKGEVVVLFIPVSMALSHFQALVN